MSRPINAPSHVELTWKRISRTKLTMAKRIVTTSTKAAIPNSQVTAVVNASDVTITLSRKALATSDVLMRGINSPFIATKTKPGKKIPAVATNAPTGPASKYPMKVAVVNTGPGVTWPTAIAPRSCESVI